MNPCIENSCIEPTAMIGVVSASAMNSFKNFIDQALRRSSFALFGILELSKNFLQLNVYGDE